MTDDEVQNLMDAQNAELRASFDLFDRNGDGRLDRDELGLALRVLGVPMTDTELTRLIASVDLDGDGYVDFAEFCLLIEPRPMGEDPDADLREAFAVLDADGDGYLSDGELRRAVARTDDMQASDVDHMLRLADLDGDGRISFAEFREAMKIA